MRPQLLLSTAASATTSSTAVRRTAIARAPSSLRRRRLVTPSSAAAAAQASGPGSTTKAGVAGAAVPTPPPPPCPPPIRPHVVVGSGGGGGGAGKEGGRSTTSTRTKLLRALGVSSAVVGATGAYIWVHPEAIGMDPETNGWELSQAVLRGLRLGKTVALIVADYKLQGTPFWGTGGPKDKRMSKEAEAALVQAEKDLRESQNEYESLSYALRAAEEKGLPEKGELEVKAKAARQVLLAAAARLARVEEHAQGVSQKGQVHQRVADRLLELCQLNLGCYIKIGQHLSNLDYLLPREITDTLKVLLNRAPVSSYEDVRAVIKEELGAYPEEIWASFEPVPIASASLAQVHVARDHQGRKLAVKVQHRGLREISRGDVAAVCFMVNLVAAVFPEFSYRWIAEEIAPQLPKELDFVNEAHNAERAATFFRHRKDVVIPAIVWPQTRARVLTMDFEEGVCATDVKSLKEMDLPLDRVAALISSVFCEQIFSSGWAHCDPHPANVLIRAHPTRKHSPVLVLLDHGLYKELPTDFRLDYCRLWKALVLKDLDGVKHYCQKLNSGEMYSLLAAVLTSRSWDDITSPDLGSLKTPSTKEDKTLIRSYAQRYYFEITELLNTVPREMLLLLKMNDCLRHIDRELGAPVNSSLITAEESVRALLREELKGRPSLGKRVRAWWDYCKIELRLQTYLYLTWAAGLLRRRKPSQQPPALPPPSPVEEEVEKLVHV